MEELKKSYQAGIATLICSAIFIILNLSLIYINNNIAILTINAISSIFIVLAIALYFKMMVGFIYIGKKYSKTLTKATYAILISIILELLLLMIIYFASIEQNTILITILSLMTIAILIIFAISKIIYGISIYKIPVKSNTKTTLSIFSMLFGISIITIIGTIFLPYIKIMEIIFQTLFLKDTYLKDHKEKTKRNLLIWIISLVLYLIIIGALTYIFWQLIIIWKQFL